jgi:glutathione S-transferase
MTEMSNEWILHHYEESPYAEKVRLMFGHTGLPWRSVVSPIMPPRPNLDPLTGGYRRIPVAQLGSDLLCDSALIAQEIAEATGHPELGPGSVSARHEALVEHAQGEVFFSVITSEPPLKLLSKWVRTFGIGQTYRFFKDRTGMMKNATIRPPSGKQAAAIVEAFFAEMDQALAEHAFLEGAAPAYADFAAIHPVKFKTDLSQRPLPERYAHLKRWCETMLAPGHGARKEMTPEKALAAAADSEPRPLPDSEPHELRHQAVRIAPADYGREPVTGRLVAVTAERYVVERQTEAFGALHVHFPRPGYDLEPATDS